MWFQFLAQGKTKYYILKYGVDFTSQILRIINADVLRRRVPFLFDSLLLLFFSFYSELLIFKSPYLV